MQSYYRRSHRFPVVAFLDIKSAYDTVDRRVIWDALSRSGAGSSPCLPLLVHLFDDVSVSVLVSNHSSAPFSPVTGVLQGSVLSPHLYSVYINTLPSLLRQVAAPANHLVPSSGSADAGMVPVNSLLFADDVAVIGSAKSVKEMLKLCEEHSLSLGYRWNPTKCAVLNHPPSSSSSSDRLQLYGTPLPLVDEFVYLGVPFVKSGLSAPSLVSLRSPGVIKVMAILNKIGVNRQGFSLLLCSRIYATFVRPKFEYGLAISRLTATDLKSVEGLQDRCLRLLVGGHRTSSTTIIKHITTLPSMRHRVDVLTTRYCLRARSLPGSCLLSLLSSTLPVSRIKAHLEKNPLFLALPSPPPSSDARLKTFFRQYRERQVISLVTSTTQALLRACRPALVVDPILYVPATRAERSLLVRWRLGWLPGKPEDCPCGRDRRSRRHFLECDLIPSFLWSDLPRCPPGSYPIDFALSSLPLGRSARCPPWWSSLLLMLWHIQRLCRPDRYYAIDSSPGASCKAIKVPYRWVVTVGQLSCGKRSLLVRWRLGWLPGKPEDCPCGRDRRSRRHFLECDLIPSFLWSDLPRCPPGSYPIDFALSSLPLGRSARCPPWWSSLLLMLWHIQRLCRPDRNLPVDSSPGASWYSSSSRNSD
ncbi:hypothetical protein G6F15_012243 [Rhizopus arrhizus]|nr:hypothetical protein G6F15_012243 [Rhizopus arrhizus]